MTKQRLLNHMNVGFASRTAAIFSVLIASLALVGWALNIKPLQSLFSGEMAMAPSSAGLIVLMGAVLVLTPTAEQSIRKILALAGSVVVMLVVLAGHGGMGPASLVTLDALIVFLLLSMALAALQCQRPPRLILIALSVFTVILPLHRLCEWLIGLDAFDPAIAVNELGSMSLTTAFCLCLLCGPALYQHPRLPFGVNLLAQSNAARLIRMALPASIFIPIFLSLGIEYRIGHNLEGSILSITCALGLLSAIGMACFWYGYEKLLKFSEELRQSVALTRSIMDSLPQSIAVIDTMGFITEVNRSWRNFGDANNAQTVTLGQTRWNYLEICRQDIGDSSAQQALAGVEDVLAGRRKSFALEYPCHSPDRQRWFLMRVNPLHDLGDGVVISHTDITQRKLAEMETQRDREQQTALRQMLETLQGESALEESLQQCLDQLLAMPWLAILPRGGIHLMAADSGYLELICTRGLPPSVQHQCKHVPMNHCLCGRAAASRKRVFASHVDECHEVTYPEMADHGHYCVPLLGKQNETLGVLVVYLQAGTCPDPVREHFLDTVAGILAGHILRKRSELALQQAETALRQERGQLEVKVRERTAELSASEARTRAVLHTMYDGVIQIDTAGTILLANYATGSLFGYSPEELIGQNISILMPDTDRLQHTGHIQRYLHTRQSKVIGKQREFRGQRQDGTTFPLELAVNELVDDSGITYIGVLRDLTLQQETEQTLERARLEAERLAQSKSDFLANMSHEIRTPLGAVLGFARIGMRENEGRKSHSACERILKSGEHLLAVVNDILDFSKLEAGKMVVDPHPMSLPSVIEDALALVEERAVQKQLVVERAIAAALPIWVIGDSLRIRQILVNLLSNAIKFTGRGHIVLAVERKEANTHFAIRDEGIGMTEDQLKRLFQPFEQADASTTRKHGGSGLGLAISRQLALLMGGDIDVTSSPGRGSTFTLRLPLPESDIIPNEQARKPLGSLHRLAKLRILAADDVDVNRLIIGDILEQEAAYVVFAHSGREALERVEETPTAFDVVLMDVQMPEMDGHDATRRILAIAPELPVIGLTAHALAEERDKCLQSGMVAHLTKPIDPEELVAAIQRYAGVSFAHFAAPAIFTQQEPAPEAAPAMAGVIDWHALELRFKHNSRFIRKILQTVVEGHQDTARKVLAARHDRDYGALAFLAHTLKGIAGNLVAGGIQVLAASAEKAATDKNPACYELADQLASAIEVMLAEIREHLESSPET